MVSERDDSWLLHPVDKAGLLCQIDNSFGRGSSDPGYLNGQYEGEEVVVLSVFDHGTLRQDKFTSRARIKFHQKSGPDDLPEIPIQYLIPVHPTQAGQSAAIVYGEYRGSSVRVKEMSGSLSIVLVDPTGLLVESKQERLCRRVEVPADTAS